MMAQHLRQPHCQSFQQWDPISIPSSSTSLPTASYSSLSQYRRPTTKHNTTTDCWYLVGAVGYDVQPTDPLLASNPALGPLTEKPHSSHISWKLCWQVRYNSRGVHRSTDPILPAVPHLHFP